MDNIEPVADHALLAAMTELWQLNPPGPDNILVHAAFLRLRETCRAADPKAGTMGMSLALSTALRALGLPCHLQHDVAHLALPVKEAAAGLDAALRATHAKRIHLAPLNLAGDLPPISFGQARICKLTAGELRDLIDAPRLQRFDPRGDFDAKRFSEFHWLVVEETVALEQSPAARGLPWLSMRMDQDLGRIEPHQGRFPSAVNDALFFLLLAPWETWSTVPEFEWRGFRIPWVHSVDSDLFVRPTLPPSPDTLSWHERIRSDVYGATHEVEEPIALDLKDNVASELPNWDQRQWEIVEQARRSALFETPIAHFLLRAFLAEGVDEFLAHITTIEAALGMHADYAKAPGAVKRHKHIRSGDRVRCRVGALLHDGEAADQYERLFDLRSQFLHGRPMNAISTAERVMARSLARRVVQALIQVSQTGSVTSREDFLNDLLDQGVASFNRRAPSPKGDH